MKTRIVYAHLGPMPIELIGHVIMKLDPQGWEKDETLFAGMGIVSTSRLSLAGKSAATQVPLYNLLVKKIFAADGPIIPPTLDIKGLSVGGLTQ